MKIKNPLYTALYVVLFLSSMWIGSIWNSRAQSEDLPPPTDQALPPDFQMPPAEPTATQVPPPVQQTPPANMQNQLPPSEGRQQLQPQLQQMPRQPLPGQGQPGVVPMEPDTSVVNPDFQTLPDGFEPPVEEIPRLPAPNAEGWVYDPTGRRDPFRPYGAPKTLTPIVQIPESLLEPLQKFDLSAIKVLGILWDVSKPRALVRDPLNKVHTVFMQTKIGKNQGVVIGIRESEILVQETYEEDGIPTKSIKILGIHQ